MRELLDEDGENRAVRSFLMLYSRETVTVGLMRDHMKLSGWGDLWPDWVAKTNWEEHLTKAGAQSWLRYLFGLEVAPAAAIDEKEKP